MASLQARLFVAILVVWVVLPFFVYAKSRECAVKILLQYVTLLIYKIWRTITSQTTRTTKVLPKSTSLRLITCAVFYLTRDCVKQSIHYCRPKNPFVLLINSVVSILPNNTNYGEIGLFVLLAHSIKDLMRRKLLNYFPFILIFMKKLINWFIKPEGLRLVKGIACNNG